MKRIWAIRIVLASPGDVQPERDAVVDAISSLNLMLRAADIPAVLELARYETDVPPGIDERGPQARIDSRLKPDQSDILIGIFWSRFGTAVYDARSGTEHEIRQAIEDWKSHGHPEVMIYFCDAPYQPSTPAQMEQYRAVQEYRGELVNDHHLLLGRWDQSQGPLTFAANVAKDLWDVVSHLLRTTTDLGTPSLRFSLSVKPNLLRSEGITELLPDLFLRCTYESAIPPAHPFWYSVIIFAVAQVTSRSWRNEESPGLGGEAVLFEVGRASASSYHLCTGISGNQIAFGRISLDELQPNETRIFQISNIRINASAIRGPIQLFLNVSGATVENGTPIVAQTVPGMRFELRNSDGTEYHTPFEFSATNGLRFIRIANLRFNEGFAGAFKTRAPVLNLGSLDNDTRGYASESHALAAVVQTPDGGIVQAGVTDAGTKLKVVFSHVPKGVTVFVSGSNTWRMGLKGKLVAAESNVLAEPRIIDNEYIYEVVVTTGEASGYATVTWEIVYPTNFASGNEPGFLEFPIFISCAPDPSHTTTLVGTATINGCFAPTSTATTAGPKAPIPRFLDTSSMRKLFTVVA